MQEIKFRAWDGKMMHRSDISDDGDFFVDCEGNVKYTYDVPYCGGATGYRRGWVLMQFTGFNDKNGKEIYEGDIIRRFVKHHRRDEEETEQRFEIRWNDEYAEFEPRAAHGWTPVLPFVMEGGATEVIGNIYENPDLLQ